MKTFLRAMSLAPDAQGQLFGRKCWHIGYWVSTAVLLIPGLRRQPWAYGIFAVLFSREIFSALASGEKRDALASSIALVLLAISFFLRPAPEQQ